jgi:hypothetical protein
MLANLVTRKLDFIKLLRICFPDYTLKAAKDAVETVIHGCDLHICGGIGSMQWHDALLAARCVLLKDWVPAQREAERALERMYPNTNTEDLVNVGNIKFWVYIAQSAGYYNS